MATMNNSKVNTFKNEALTAVDAAKNMFSEISMNMGNISKFLKSDTDSEYHGMCVSLTGLVANGYLDKDITTYGGVILIEVPYDGSETKYMVWMHNSTYGINGVEKNKINGLKFKKTNNDAGTTSTDGTDKTSDDVNGGKLGIVTKLCGINLVVSEGKTSTSTTAMQRGTATADNGSIDEAGTVSGPHIASITSIGVRGGTDKTYENIPCINSSLD